MRDNVAATDMFNFLSCVYVIKEVANMKLHVTIDLQDHLLHRNGSAYSDLNMLQENQHTFEFKITNVKQIYVLITLHSFDVGVLVQVMRFCWLDRKYDYFLV